jgi:hypothetical protein
MNAGRVELDLVAVGKDQVSAMLRNIDAQAKKTAEGLKKTGEAAETASAKVSTIGNADALKNAAAPVNKLREVFENLRGNAGFVLSAIASGAALAGAAIEALTGDLFKGSAAMREWETTRGSMADGMKKTTAIAAELRAELDKLQGKTANTLDIKTDQANERLTEINRQLAVGEKATKEFRESLEMMRLSPAFVFAAESFAEEEKKNAADLVSLKKQQLELNNLNLEAERERTVESLRQVAALQAFLRGDKPAAANTDAAANLKVDPTLVPGYVAPGSTKPRGGGRSGSRPEADKRTLAEILAGPTGNDDLSKALEGFDANPLDAWIEKANKQAEESAKIFEKIGGDKKNNFASALSDTELAARAASEAFDLLATSGANLDAVLPGLSGAFAQISDIWAATDGSAKSMAQGVLGSVDAIANAGAAWLKDEKARTRFLGAKELLLAAPLWFIDPAQAAVKTATGIGLLALGGGGGAGAGGGARSSSGGSAGYMPDRTSGGGPSGPMIVNISTFASDPHTMTRMIAQSRRGTAGTGISQASAA